MNTSSAQFADLVERARHGDGDAVGKLLDSYRTYILLLARMQISRQLQGKVSPSDVVQETLVRARQYFGQFRGTAEEELIVWLRKNLASTIARLVRHYKAQRRDVNLEQRLDAELEESSSKMRIEFTASQSSPSEQASRRECEVLLASALEKLSVDCREVIVLRNLEGLSFPEIAERMGCTVRSAKHLWTKGLAKLRQSLGEM